MSRIISFRGNLADEEQDRLRLSTNTGSIGYRIVKFQVMGPDASETAESAIKIYKIKQPVIDGNIDFSDNTLLAAAIYQQNVTGQNYPIDALVIFDNEIFNQDIFISGAELKGGLPVNYMIELTPVPLSKDEATVATLKDMRAGPDTNFGP